MFHKKCGGVVYHDRLYRNSSFIDLVCFDCKHRWHVDRTNSLAKLVLRNNPYDEYGNEIPTVCDCVYCHNRRVSVFGKA